MASISGTELSQQWYAYAFDNEEDIISLQEAYNALKKELARDPFSTEADMRAVTKSYRIQRRLLDERTRKLEDTPLLKKYPSVLMDSWKPVNISITLLSQLIPQLIQIDHKKREYRFVVLDVKNVSDHRGKRKKPHRFDVQLRNVSSKTTRTHCYSAPSATVKENWITTLSRLATNNNVNVATCPTDGKTNEKQSGKAETNDNVNIATFPTGGETKENQSDKAEEIQQQHIKESSWKKLGYTPEKIVPSLLHEQKINYENANKMIKEFIQEFFQQLQNQSPMEFQESCDLNFVNYTDFENWIKVNRRRLQSLKSDKAMYELVYLENFCKVTKWTPLHLAALNNDPNADGAKILYDHVIANESKAEIPQLIESAFLVAITRSSIDVLKIWGKELFNNAFLNSSVDSTHSKCWHVLLTKATIPKSLQQEMLSFVLKLKIPLDRCVRDDYSPLHYACIYCEKNTNLLRLLLESGAREGLATITKSKQNISSLWPLHLAAYFNKPNIAEVLLRNGYEEDINRHCPIRRHHKTPLHLAAEQGHVEVAHVLLSKGAANPNVLMQEGGHVQNTLKELRISANVNYSALALQVMNTCQGVHRAKKKPKMVELLLRYGANPSIFSPKVMRNPGIQLNEITETNVDKVFSLSEMSERMSCYFPDRLHDETRDLLKLYGDECCLNVTQLRKGGTLGMHKEFKNVFMKISSGNTSQDAPVKISIHKTRDIQNCKCHGEWTITSSVGGVVDCTAVNAVGKNVWSTKSINLGKNCSIPPHAFRLNCRSAYNNSAEILVLGSSSMEETFHLLAKLEAMSLLHAWRRGLEKWGCPLLPQGFGLGGFNSLLGGFDIGGFDGGGGSSSGGETKRNESDEIIKAGLLSFKSLLSLDKDGLLPKHVSKAVREAGLIHAVIFFMEDHGHRDPSIIDSGTEALALMCIHDDKNKELVEKLMSDQTIRTKVFDLIKLDDLTAMAQSLSKMANEMSLTMANCR